MSRIRSRLQALENRLITEPVTLRFADGSTALIPSRVCGRDHIADLFGCIMRGERSPELDLLAKSESASEPGGGHMLELARAILLSPSQPQTETGIEASR